jgi:chitinase
MLDEKYPEEHKLVTTAVSTYTYLDAEGKRIEHLDERWSEYMDAFYIMVTAFSHLGREQKRS